MEDFMSEKTGTVRLHRVLRAPAERVYKAFTDKSALLKMVEKATSVTERINDDNKKTEL